MTVKEFNEKYKDYLEEGHYGLSLGSEEFVKWLDDKFQSFIKYQGFQYSQIKSKFGRAVFYAKGIPSDKRVIVEHKLQLDIDKI